MEPVILGKRGRFIFYLALTILVVAVKLKSPEALERLEWKFQDILYEFKGAEPISKDVVIVNIDDLSLRELGPWPWKEEVTADLVAAVGTAKPKSVLLDFPLPDYPKELRADSGGIADQLFWMKNVIVSYDVVPSEKVKDTVTNPKYLFRDALVTNSDLGRLSKEQALSVRTVSLPDSASADAAARLGFSYSTVDPDDVLRSDPLVMEYQGYYYPSLSLAAASHYLNVLPEHIVVHGGSDVELGDRFIPTTSSGEMLMNFPVNGSGFNIMSASDVLNQRVDFEEFKNKLVIVTIGADAQTEYYKTPVANETPRYLLTAVATDNILKRNYLRRADSRLGWYILALVLIGAISAYTLQRISSLYRLVVVAVGLIALANINFFLFSSFNLLANSIYVALLLTVFLVASPLVDVDYSFLPFLRPKPEEDEAELETQSNSQTKVSTVSVKTTQLDTSSVGRPAFVARGSNNETTAFNQTMATMTMEELVKPGASTQDPSKTVALNAKDEAATQHISSSDESSFASAPEEAPVDKTVAMPSNNADDSKTTAIADAQDQEETAMFGDLTSAVVDEPVGEAENSDSPAAEAPLQPEHKPVDPEAISPDNEPAPSPEIEKSDLPPETPEPKPRMITADSGSLGTPAGEPEQLGRYQIDGVLGKGAMGMVYGGVDPAINRKVALKTIRLDFLSDPDEMAEMKERLFLEAQAAGKLNHPNIVTIYDVGSEGAVQYIAMELIEGQTLEDMIKRKVNFNFKIVARMIYQICQALQYAHDAGIVHRDIKPANIMVLPDYSIKVMDFGIARVESSSMTKTGVAMGTPNYISPEQLQGKKIDGRSDLFSLGIVFHEMLVGSRPFKGDNLTSLIYSIVNTEPEAPSKKNPRIPPLFDHIVAQSLKKDPNERYQRASDISAALSDFVQSFATR